MVGNRHGFGESKGSNDQCYSVVPFVSLYSRSKRAVPIAPPHEFGVRVGKGTAVNAGQGFFLGFGVPPQQRAHALHEGGAARSQPHSPYQRWTALAKQNEKQHVRIGASGRTCSSSRIGAWEVIKSPIKSEFTSLSEKKIPGRTSQLGNHHSKLSRGTENEKRGENTKRSVCDNWFHPPFAVPRKAGVRESFPRHVQWSSEGAEDWGKDSFGNTDRGAGGRSGLITSTLGRAW